MNRAEYYDYLKYEKDACFQQEVIAAAEEKGIEKGIEKGKKEEKQGIARNLLAIHNRNIPFVHPKFV